MTSKIRTVRRFGAVRFHAFEHACFYLVCRNTETGKQYNFHVISDDGEVVFDGEWVSSKEAATKQCRECFKDWAEDGEKSLLGRWCEESLTCWGILTSA